VWVALVTGLAPLTGAQEGGGVLPQDATLVLLNGKIVTVDDRLPEAEAVAIRGDVIAAVGSNDEIRAWVDERTRVMDLHGALAVPGFIDAHAHLMNLGRAKLRLELAKAKTWTEIVGMVERRVREARPGEWILGRGWHQEKWTMRPDPSVGGLPTHDALSAVSPENPVLLTHASGHSAIANTRAMELAGITVDTADPEGGKIVRDHAGVPIGVFREEAMSLVRNLLKADRATRTPAEIDAEDRRAFALGQAECLSKGITTLHDAGASCERIDFFKRMAEEGALTLRLYVMLSDSNHVLERRLPEYRIVGAAGNHLTVRAIKRLIDGALGSHGAWLLEPYSDLPASSGLNTEPIAAMRETARLAQSHGFQFCTHAIGDRAIRTVLDIYEEIYRRSPKGDNLRWRIEHAQHIDPEDIPRFGESGIIASMQPIHCVSDGPWVPKRIGESRAAAGAYAWRKLIDSGAVICSGTDAPVEDIDPLANFHAAVTRQLGDGSRFHPDQRMTREQALDSYTINAAYAAFEENLKGSITPGKLADITILSTDIMTVEVSDILRARVVATIVGGRVAYRTDDPECR